MSRRRVAHERFATRVRAAAVGCAMTALPGAALGHTLPGPEDHAARWPPDALLTAALLLAAAVWYARGWRALRRKGQRGPGMRRQDASLFGGALILLAFGLAGPLDGWASRSFAAHMAQHLLLALAAAPLLVAAHPISALVAFRHRRGQVAAHRGLARLLSASNAPRAIVWATLLQGGVMWFWHAPMAYEAALRSDVIHVLEHVMLLASALWFWHAVWRGMATRGGLLAAMVGLLLTVIHSGMLGGLLVFAGKPLYASYVLTLGGDGAIVDQQWAGLLMWVPASFAYLVIALALSHRFLAKLQSARAHSEL